MLSYLIEESYKKLSTTNNINNENNKNNKNNENNTDNTSDSKINYKKLALYGSLPILAGLGGAAAGYYHDINDQTNQITDINQLISSMNNNENIENDGNDGNPSYIQFQNEAQKYLRDHGGIPTPEYYQKYGSALAYGKWLREHQ